MSSDLTREQEIALLGILEGQLGERQRQMNGLNLDEDMVRLDHEAFVRLQRDIAADRAAAVVLPVSPQGPSPRQRSPRHQRPGLLTGRAGGMAAAVCLLVLVAFVLLVVG